MSIEISDRERKFLTVSVLTYEIFNYHLFKWVIFNLSISKVENVLDYFCRQSLIKIYKHVFFKIKISLHFKDFTYLMKDNKKAIQITDTHSDKHLHPKYSTGENTISNDFQSIPVKLTSV